MKPKHISDALNMLNDDIIEETEKLRKYRRPRSARRWKWLTAAACLCVIIASMAALPRLTEIRPDNPTMPELPMLELPELTGTGMGFDGVFHYDITELYNGNPWNESLEFTTLPVYQNGSYTAVGEPTGLGKDDMLRRLEAAAEALGTEIPQTEYEMIYAGTGSAEGPQPDAAITRITAATDGIAIEVTADGTATVQFDGGLSLPEGYHFTASDTAYNEAEKALDYLTERYSALIGFSQPEKILSGSYAIGHDYDQAGHHIPIPIYSHDYLLYESAGDNTEHILNYTFRYVEFVPDADGNLMMIRIHDGLCCAKKLGDYPVITAEEALSLLLAGKYLTDVPYDIEDEASVCKVELVYRRGAFEKVLMPYYRFYVELPETEQNNVLTSYGAYYVPAIEAQYIVNMPDK